MESGWIVFPLGLLSESPCDAEGHHIVAGPLANSLSVWTCVVICFDSIALSSISRPNLQVPLVKTNPEKSFLWLSMAVFAVAFRFCICSIALTPFLAISRLRCSTIESVSIPESPVERFKSWERNNQLLIVSKFIFVLGGIPSDSFCLKTITVSVPFLSLALPFYSVHPSHVYL